MKFNRNKLRRMILKEMDMAGMGADPSLIEHAKSVIELGISMGMALGPLVLILLTIPLSPGILFRVLEDYHRGLLSEEEFKAMMRIRSEQGNEAARNYFNSVVNEKGYDTSGMSPRHRETGRRDASYAQDYNKEFGDILPPSEFDFDDDD